MLSSAGSGCVAPSTDLEPAMSVAEKKSRKKIPKEKVVER
jgi:hypothetical protein